MICPLSEGVFPCCFIRVIYLELPLSDEERLACLLSTPHPIVLFVLFFFPSSILLGEAKKKKKVQVERGGGGGSPQKCVYFCGEKQSPLELLRRDLLIY